MGVQAIIDQLHRTCAVSRGATVTLVRGEAETANVPVVIGRRSVPVMQGDGVLLEVDCREYLIGRADYAFDDQAVEPLAGDQIKETDGDVVRTHQVLPLAAEAEKRFADPHYRVYLIHTMQISVAPVEPPEDE